MCSHARLELKNVERLQKFEAERERNAKKRALEEQHQALQDSLNAGPKKPKASPAKGKKN
jgi:hypothetical protein